MISIPPYQSIILNMLKLIRTADRLAQPLSVLDVTAIGTDSGVKDIAEGMFP